VIPEATVRAALEAAAGSSTPPRYALRLEGWGRVQAYSRAERRRVATMAGRVLGIIDAAQPADLEAGRVWYAQARRDVRAEAQAWGLEDLERAVAVTAAVSSGLAWASNIPALAAILEHVRTGRPLADAVRARGIGLGRPGWGPWAHALEVLERGPHALSGDKRRGFGAGIITAGETLEVAVDGHAALGAEHGALAVRPGITAAPSLAGRAYDLRAAAYAVAAHALGVTPAQAQAMAWTAWRRIPTRGRP